MAATAVPTEATIAATSPLVMDMGGLLLTLSSAATNEGIKPNALPRQTKPIDPIKPVSLLDNCVNSWSKIICQDKASGIESDIGIESNVRLEGSVMTTTLHLEK